MARRGAGSARASSRRGFRPVRWIVGGLGAAGLVLLAYLAFSGYQMFQQAQQVRATTALTVSAATAGDVAATAAALDRLSIDASSLESQLTGPVWTLLGRLPVVGSWVAAAQTLAGSAAGVAEPAASAAHAAAPLVAARGRTSGGAIDLRGIASLSDPLDQVGLAAESAMYRLSAVDAAGLPSPLGDAIDQAVEQLAPVPAAATAAAEATRRLPGLLGADGPRRWLVVLQNLSEARGTGGIIGSYLVVTADQGRITIDELDGNNAITATPVPQKSMPEAFRELWGSDPAEWSSFNMSLHYPYAAKLAADGMAVRGIDVDGVLMLDQQAVAGILAGTGPVTAEGVTLSAADAVEFLTSGAYARFPDTARKDAVVNALLKATVERALAGSVDIATMVNALSSPVSEGRVLVWSEEPSEQEWLATMPVGGSLPETPGPFVAAAFNNGAGNKMDAYVSASLDYQPGVCPSADVQSSRIVVRLRNGAPALLPDYVTGRLDDPTAPEYSTKLLVHVYGPVGAELVGATLDGEVQDVSEGLERGHPVWRYDVTLDRGQSRELVVDLEEPSVPGAVPQVIAQPMSNDEVVTVTPNPTCP